MVSVPPHVVPAIAHHLEAMTAVCPDALHFPGRDGVSHVQASTLHRNLRMPRDLRHAGATRATRAGATLADLQQRLGHS